MERTWEIKEHKGGKWVARTVTLAQYKAEVAARREAGRPIMDALRQGGLASCELAQATFRAQFD